jgi:excisionase family DNA binding protein
MNAERPGTVPEGAPRPLLVSPREACRLLSIGLTRLYEILNTGELDSVLIGRSRRISVASIHSFVQRQIAAKSIRN